MAELDLDAFRAARAEARQDEVEFVVVLKGERFECPPEIPWDVGWALASNNIPDAVTALFGEEEAARFWALKPSVPDLEALFVGSEDNPAGLAVLYPSVTSGEGSGASRRRSNSTTKPSKPTSNGSTGSGSAKRSSAKSRKASGGSRR